MLHTRPGLTNGARDAVIAACNIHDKITCTWTTDMRPAGQTWIGTVSQVVGAAGARTSISVDFGEYKHQVMPFGAASARYHALTRSQVADPLDEAMTVAAGGKRATAFEIRDVLTHVIYIEGRDAREQAKDLITYQGLVRGLYLGSGRTAMDPARTVDRSFREGAMNDFLLTLVLWLKGCQVMVAAQTDWRSETNLAMGDQLIAALDTLYIANMDGAKFGSIQAHRAELEKGEGSLRGRVLSAFNEAMKKPRDLAGKK